jgi:3-carboxy-cis,cis-muconate cycloisomerase
MRQSSSRSELFGYLDARGEVADAVGDEAWLAALLAVEAALARALAAVGLVPVEVADEIVDACRDRDAFDLAAIGAAAAESGAPVLPLVKALRGKVSERAAQAVHYGATTQDIMDSAAMLVARDALAVVRADLAGCGQVAMRLAVEHRRTEMIGRTLLRQAVPITFGVKAAGWMVGLDEAAARLDAVAGRLAAQLGGAAGTLATYRGSGLDVLAAFARELGLAEPVASWHTNRLRIAELAGGLGAAAGFCGKVARDILLLAQDEVAEVHERSPGGSSAMPHKQNAVAAVCASACAARSPGLVATVLSTMDQEHERAAGGWHAEWRPLRELFTTTGSAAAWLRGSLDHLVVDPGAMAANLNQAVARGVPHSAADLDAASQLVDRVLERRHAG